MVDQFDNPAAPGPEYSVGVSIIDGRAKMKLTDLALHSDFKGYWSDAAKGEYSLSYTAQHAGHAELHLWWQREAAQSAADIQNGVEAKATRESFPGSPFSIHVLAGEPSVHKTYLDQWAVGHESKKTGGGKGGDGKGKGGNEKNKQSNDDSGLLSMTAGDTVSESMPHAAHNTHIWTLHLRFTDPGPNALYHLALALT